MFNSEHEIDWRDVLPVFFWRNDYGMMQMRLNYVPLTALAALLGWWLL